MDTFNKFKKSINIINCDVSNTGTDDNCVSVECMIETDVGTFEMNFPWFYHCEEPEKGAELLEALNNNPIKFITKYIEDSSDNNGVYSNLDNLTILNEKNTNQKNQKKFNDSPTKFVRECRFGSKCTNDDCKFDHSKKENKFIGTTTDTEFKRECRFGTRCRNDDCKFNHPQNNNVTIESDTNKRNCRFGSKCRNDNCTFNHQQNNDETEHNNSRFPREKKECRFGSRCRNDNCNFYHPQNNNENDNIRHNITRECRFGINCRNDNCKFAHSQTDNLVPNHRNYQTNQNTKICKFGSNCRANYCKFIHNEISAI
jgi:hypothetical protein